MFTWLFFDFPVLRIRRKEPLLAVRLPSTSLSGWFMSSDFEWVLLHLLYGLIVCDGPYSGRGNKQLPLQRTYMSLSLIIWMTKHSSVNLKVKHVFKAHKVGLKCQKILLWIGLKAVKAQTLTHQTISLLTNIGTKHFWRLKK